MWTWLDVGVTRPLLFFPLCIHMILHNYMIDSSNHLKLWRQLPNMDVVLYTLDISRFNIARYCTQYNIFECETSARLWTHERHPYLALTGEPWVSFVSYLEKSDREVSGVHCIHYAVRCFDTSETKIRENNGAGKIGLVTPTPGRSRGAGAMAINLWSGCWKAIWTS